jgi:hypothetical protein
VAGNEKQHWFTVQMPHDWREGSTVYPHVHWNLEDTTDCNTRWCWEYAIDGDWPANTSAQCANCPSGATVSEDQVCDIFGSGLSMAGKVLSTLILVRLYRNSSNAADTCDGKDAYLHTSDVHYRKDRPGSKALFTK